jgi:hypothetical protein
MFSICDMEFVKGGPPIGAPLPEEFRKGPFWSRSMSSLQFTLRASIAASAIALAMSLTGDVDQQAISKGSVHDAMRALMSCGLTVKQAAGLTGELYAESELGALDKGRVLGEGTGDGGSASGVAQWHPVRWREMTSWAISQKLDPHKLSTQYKMVCQEAKDHYGQALKAMEAAQNVVELERAAQLYEGNKSGPGRSAALLGVRKALKAVGSNFGSTRSKIRVQPKISGTFVSSANYHHSGRS